MGERVRGAGDHVRRLVCGNVVRGELDSDDWLAKNVLVGSVLLVAAVGEYV